jgi:hypothetical protein
MACRGTALLALRQMLKKENTTYFKLVQSSVCYSADIRNGPDGLGLASLKDNTIKLDSDNRVYFVLTVLYKRTVSSD